ncbi:DUF6286 domain-containing protein [Streptomyces sp. NPDC001027]|uniref:DUF6286 domain-containing protein n=1 Tax=Streptomyces sp. NPDC001027 TaxID=3154771 RepID=UPI003326864A
MSEPGGLQQGGAPVLEKDAEDAAPPGQGGGPDGGRPADRRFWSARRVPAAVVAVLLAAVAGVFLYDVVAVRAHRPAMAWRRGLAHQLAERPLDDPWVLVGAGVAAALGLWLIVLAVTPGIRQMLPMRRPRPDVRAGLHRAAAALVLRDRAMEVAGVRSARARAGRRRAEVSVVSHFRDLDDVRADLDSVLTEAVHGLGLVRPLGLSVHVRRAGKKG